MKSGLSRDERRAGGIYYTPLHIVRELVGKTLRGKSGRLRVLDPACGEGVMLIAARRPGVELFGIDCDPAAVCAARLATAGEIWCGDALFDRRLEKLAPFDAIVANPPYLSIRQLAKSRPREYVEQLRRRYRTARGNFDLYCLFLERSLELLRPGGRCGIIIPNKWATLDYAQPLRKLLLAETMIEHVMDFSSQRVFAAASVYPQIVVVAKRRPPKRHCVKASSGSVPQRSLSAEAISFSPAIDVESRAATRPLGELCKISCGTAGYSARRIADALVEWQRGAKAPRGTSGGRHDANLPHWDFITSGNIDRYQVRLGNVRYLGRVYSRPVLPLDAAGVTERQRRLFASEKIVIAGLSQRLEAAWDERGLALGVQVFAAGEFEVNPQYLLALLNSKVLAYLFRTRFAAKRLAGGYMAINKGQLSKLPIAVPSVGQRSSVGGLVENPSYGDDDEIDQWVYRLYGLTKAEIATVEGHFADLGRRAA